MAVAKAPKISPGNRRFGRPILTGEKGVPDPGFRSYHLSTGRKINFGICPIIVI